MTNMITVLLDNAKLFCIPIFSYIRKKIYIVPKQVTLITVFFPFSKLHFIKQQEKQQKMLSFFPSLLNKVQLRNFQT